MALEIGAIVPIQLPAHEPHRDRHLTTVRDAAMLEHGLHEHRSADDCVGPRVLVHPDSQDLCSILDTGHQSELKQSLAIA